MDHVLIKNWNYTVSSKNLIYYLGDFRYGADAGTAEQYRRRLRGEIVFIRGNHDDPSTGPVTHAEMVFEGIRFFLVHDPADAPPEFDGWVIHGHHHNNDLRNYPFMNFTGRRVNVSAEVVGYAPVGLHGIVERIRNRERTGDTTPILFRDNGEKD
jgi:calcineurin-like phosphoesterase family protein